MKRALCLGTLVLAGLFSFPLSAEAGDRQGRWSFGFGFGGNGSFFQAGYSREFHSSRIRHIHCRVPYYTKVWVPAAYERCFVGYDTCRRPIFRTICVRPGYYESVIAGYHCSECNVRC